MQKCEIEISFWNKLCSHKMDIIKIKVEPVPIKGFIFINQENILRLNENSFSNQENLGNNNFSINGEVVVLNHHIDINNDFKEHIKHRLQHVIQNNNGIISVNMFYLFVFWDLKNHTVYYKISSPIFNVRDYLEIKNYPKNENVSYLVDFNFIKFYEEPFFLDHWIFMFLYKEEKNTILKIPLKTKELIKNVTQLKPIDFETIDENFLTNRNQNIFVIDLKLFTNSKEIQKVYSSYNLKLIKWQIIPNLNIQKIEKQKVLIIGMGSLGCEISQLLVSWNIMDLSIIDNNKVTYNNLGRQSLYSKYQINMRKVDAAKDKLLDFNDNLNIKSYDMDIPMIGHINDLQILYNYQKLQHIMSENDVIFICLDTREARWLPSLLAHNQNKFGNTILIYNVAVGFDNFFVIRHGLPYENLSCYFCNDLSSLNNSTEYKTIDQLCTIVRPSIPKIASSIAVDMFINLIDASLASPYKHVIRGHMNEFNFIKYNDDKNINCICCGDTVIQSFQENPDIFLTKCFEDTKFLEITAKLEIKTIKEIKQEDDFNIID